MCRIVVGDRGISGPIRFQYQSDETEALSWQGFDKALFLTRIADRAPGSI